MTRIDRSALVMYSARQMYDLVNDIESYPLFMQGCQKARVISRTDSEVIGELTLGKAGLQHSFTTRNTVKPGEEMCMGLVEGPFRTFGASMALSAAGGECLQGQPADGVRFCWRINGLCAGETLQSFREFAGGFGG
jgi:ribosome-associated toxin RatA of RatAB toxin-antitoxin module